MKKKFKFIGLFLCAFFVVASVIFSGDSSKIFANLTKGSSNNNAVAAVNNENYVPKKDYSSNLVANYKMDETSGTVCKDSSGNGNDGTYSGTTSVTDNDGTYRSFNGINDYIQFSKPIIPIGKKSIKFMVKTNAASNTMYLVNQDYSDPFTGNLILMSTSGKISWFESNGGNRLFTITSNKSINDNLWHQVMFIWDGTTNTNGVKLYIDDLSNPDAQVTASSNLQSKVTNNLSVGLDNRTNINWYFKGSLKNLQIYNDVIDYNSIATGITLNKTTDSIEENKTDTLTAAVTPDDTTNKTVKWTSSDTGIAKVDENTGEITAGNNEGTVTITATTQDGSNLSAKCTVTVTKANNPTPITDDSDKAALNVTMTNGQVKQYNVTMNEVNKFISWYKLRSAGSGDPFYEFDITQSSNPDIKRTDYVIFDKISSFEVDDYTK
ncbi:MULTISPECIES: LamG-like jellyroll fold domain-containing protein [Clostridium]|uniref:LamG-like jellyroll fold domain-containing protein n=1 Tax=Clostridium TaxID=1485 RepID=UPI0009C0345F|nr:MULTISPECIES: LamG-like jellyroll fold domain-containing protein [Clostridium]PJI07019.1 hypothetical protein CUB90_03695 [Clostridium sp. CT7]